MFLKVFKYDFKAVFFKFLPVFAILPVIALVARIVNLIPTNSLFPFILKIGVNGMFGLGCVFLVVYTMVICIARYVKSLFRDQGYLTHTLPVTKHSLLLSHLLVDFLMQIISVIFIIVCVFIGYVTPNIIEGLVQVINETFKLVITEEEFLQLILGPMILMFFVSIVSSLQQLFIIYTGVALGHAFAKNKGILSVVFCIAISYGISIGTGIVNNVFGFVWLDFNFQTPEALVGFINAFLGIVLAEGIIICVVAYFLDIFLMKKHLNLE